MKHIQSMSLRLWLPLLVAGIFVALWSIMVWKEHRNLELELVSFSLRSVTQDMASLQREMEKEFSRSHSIEAGQALSARGVNTRYQVLVATDERGRILHATRLALRGQRAVKALPDFDPQHFTLVQRENRADVRLAPDQQRITAYFPLTLARRSNAIRPLHTGVLFTIYDLSTDQAQIWNQVWRTSLPIGLLLLAAMAALIGFLHRFVTQPMRYLVSAAQALAEGEPGVLCNLGGHGELACLGNTFNEMSLQLKRRSEQRRQAEVALLENEQRLSQLLNTLPYGIQENDTKGVITYSNIAHHRILGMNPGDLIGRYIWDFQADSKQANELRDYLAHLVEEQLSPEVYLATNITGDGREVILEIHWDYQRDAADAVTGFISVISDITKRKQQEEQILHQANFDTLTNLPNRFLSLDRLSQLLNEAKRDNELVAVLFLDLDDFKKVNDTLGHETGDRLLIEAAERLRGVVRSSDTVGRLGGDEFIVLLGGLSDAADARPVAENLLNSFRDVFKIDNRQLTLTASVGIAVFPGDGDSASELLRNADSAMYHAKDIGRGAYAYFTETMNREVSRRLALEEQIHGALNRGEFTVFYQPQVDVSSGSIIGAEALLRWQNPALGEVSPKEFIPIAEQTGSIVPIGQFVLTEALGMCAKWQQKYEPIFRMAINLSPRQFRDPELVSFVEKAIHQSGITGDHLELEITEGVLMSGHAYIDEALAAFHNMGVRITMDDFGTGYSSLSYLRSYPFDVLKIDRSFISDITVDAADRALINATVAMAHGLHLKVVVEGVETEEQLACLKELGCDYAQGYLFSKPVSAKDMTGMLESGTGERPFWVDS